MVKRESELQGRFTPWLKKPEGIRFVTGTLKVGAVAWELKLTEGVSIAFSKIPEHQIVSLLRASGNRVWGDLGPLVHKLSDSAAGYLPCDCFSIMNGGGYFVLGFLNGKRVFVVDVKFLVEEIYLLKEGEWNRRKGSLSMDWAEGVGVEIFMGG